MLNRAICSLSVFLVPFFAFAQDNTGTLLQSGPMTGYAAMREALIWVQTTRSAKVYATYSDNGNPEKIMNTNTVLTCSRDAFTAKLIADSAEPGRQYSYRLFINDQPVALPYPTDFSTPPLWRWRGDPPEFTMLTGSCAYINQSEYDRPGTPYGGDYEIFNSMAARKADFMLWLGDNAYLREPDWNSRTGIIRRFTHTRSLPELQPFLASTHHYAIWDDHDYGPDNSNQSFYNKNETFRAFQLFTGNPTYGAGTLQGAVSAFQWGDADFFLLDNRWYRDPDELKAARKTILGTDQLKWLFDNLVCSRATFKIVAMGGQFLSDAAQGEDYSANGFNEERESIIRFIHEQNIRNVIFLTGDVHFAEASVLREEGQAVIYDFTFSPLTSGPNTEGAAWKNSYRIPGTVVMKRNYGMLRFSGPAGNRKLIIGCYGTNNQKYWEKIITAE